MDSIETKYTDEIARFVFSPLFINVKRAPSKRWLNWVGDQKHSLKKACRASGISLTTITSSRQHDDGGGQGKENLAGGNAFYKHKIQTKIRI